MLPELDDDALLELLAELLLLEELELAELEEELDEELEEELLDALLDELEELLDPLQLFTTPPLPHWLLQVLTPIQL